MVRISKLMKWCKNPVIDLFGGKPWFSRCPLWWLFSQGLWIACNSATFHTDSVLKIPSEAFSTIATKGPKSLLLKGQMGRDELTAYHSQSVTQVFDGNELRSHREESLDFKILSKTTKTDRYIHQVVSVAEKDGTADLHDLAFPEIGEELLLILTPQGKVVQAGNYQTNSIFYVPPLSLPEQPVDVGDTWFMKAYWTHSKSGTRMSLQVLTIFKELLRCGNDECADLEISGSVEPVDLAISLRSEIKGRLLFNRSQGSLVWGVLYNREEFRQESRVLVSSCLESVLLKPSGEAWPGKKAECKPEEISAN